MKHYICDSKYCPVMDIVFILRCPDLHVIVLVFLQNLFLCFVVYVKVLIALP